MLIKFLNLLSKFSASFNDLKLFLLIKFLNLLSNSSVSSNSSLSLSSSYPNIACSNSLTICFKVSLLTFFFAVLNSSRASFLFLTRSIFMMSIKVRRVNNSNESLSPLYLEKTSEAIFLYKCKSFIHDTSIKLFLSSLSSLSSFPLSFPLNLHHHFHYHLHHHFHHHFHYYLHHHFHRHFHYHLQYH